MSHFFFFPPVRSLLPLGVLLGSASFMSLGACTATHQETECASNAECRTLFGPGSVCVNDGFCQLQAREAECQHATPSDLLLDPGKYTNTIVFGTLFQTAGKEQARQDSVELAVDAVNDWLDESRMDHPELGELRLGVVQCNHDGSIEGVTRLARHLVDTIGASVLLGPSASSRTIPAYEALNLSEDGKERQQVVFITPSATAVTLTNLEKTKPGMLWRTAPRDDIQGRLMAEYALELGLPAVAFYEDSAYGRGLFEEFSSQAEELCSDCGFSYDASSTDTFSLTKALNSDNARSAIDDAGLVLFLGAIDEHIREFLENIDDPIYDGKTLLLSDGAASSDNVQVVPESRVANIMGTQVSQPGDTEARRFFTAAYESRHDESPLIHSFTANTYDAAWLAAVATLRARLQDAEVTPQTIAEALRHLSAPEWHAREENTCPTDSDDDGCSPIVLDRGSLDVLLEEFLEGRDVDVTGASGSLDYCGDEELVKDSRSFELWHLEANPNQGEDAPTYVIASEAAMDTSLSEPPTCE